MKIQIASLSSLYQSLSLYPIILLLTYYYSSNSSNPIFVQASSTQSINPTIHSFEPFNPSSQKPTTFILSNISNIHQLTTLLLHKLYNAKQLAELEQSVEDYNASEIIAKANSIVEAVSRRRLIVLPLNESLFNPPKGVFSHGHVMTGDKMSLPKEFWTAIQQSHAEVPWLFEVSRVDGITSNAVQLSTSTTTTTKLNTTPTTTLPKVIGGALDFRSPSNYIFLPHWMMKALHLKPRDVVDIQLITTIPPGSHVKLRPHTSDFTSITNHQAVLETELKHYSCLTKGSVIPFDYRGKRYFFDVVELRSSPRGERVNMVKVQDCDIAAEFIRAKDQLNKKKKKKQIRKEE